MAAFDTCYEWMMDNEDRARACAIVPDAPPGAHAISGINSASFPAEFAAIAALKQPQRGPAVKAFYQSHFWNTWFDQLESDELAKRVFDAAVNMGSGEAVRLLQIGLQAALGAFVAVDGKWGPQTLQHANACDPAMLVSSFKNARAQHYRDIAQKNPALAGFLNGWLVRAEK